MLWVPTAGDQKVITNCGIVGSANPGTQVPDGGSVNTYGTVTELISAANNVQDSWGIMIHVAPTLNPSAIVGEMSLDILIGGATDDVLISSLLCGGGYTGGNGRTFFFPVHVPGGVRIAAQLSAGAAQTTEAYVMVWLYSGSVPPFPVGRKVTTYGTKVNNSRGVAVTPTASGGAASVTQITASTTEDCFYLLPGFQVSTDSTISAVGMQAVGIGVGASTEERIQTWWFGKNAGELQSGPVPPFGCFRDVPSGTRLTILASNSGANDTAHDALIYAVS